MLTFRSRETKRIEQPKRQKEKKKKKKEKEKEKEKENGGSKLGRFGESDYDSISQIQFSLDFITCETLSPGF